MYLPSYFRAEGWEELARENPLATVISGEQVSHLPLLLEGDTLIGHLARANPHASALEGECRVIFHGPQAYVTPLWYETDDVPTWNYLVAHVHGEARLLPPERTEEALRKLSDRMEGAGGWQFYVPEDLTGVLHKVIAGFEIKIHRVEMKAKLSQNRSAADRQGVIEGLRERGDPGDLAVARWMEKLSKF